MKSARSILSPGPAEVTLVRHAESAGNVARDAALAANSPTIEIDARDCDVPLSALGERQAAALGRWWRRNSAPFDALIVSPYVRAQQTAALALEAAEWRGLPVEIDERLREKELGTLDKLTTLGIEARFPEQVATRQVLGKFYYRPPGGESWVDVLLRLRSTCETIRREHAGLRLAVVSHQVIVLCFRYLIERLTEAEVLAIDQAGEVANCSLTTYRQVRGPGSYELVVYNHVAPIEQAGEAVTSEPDVPVAPN